MKQLLKKLFGINELKKQRKADLYKYTGSHYIVINGQIICTEIK